MRFATLSVGLVAMALGGFGAACMRTSEPLTSPAASEIAKVVSARCTKPIVCGQLAYTDCGSALDRPAYYYHRTSGKILGTCGGACWRDETGRCKRECPPPGWTCGRPQPSLAK
jgi:hypothetical protein